MYIPWYYGWRNGVIFPQLWRKSGISWVALVACKVDAFGSCESNSCTQVMAMLAPWFSVCLGVASMARRHPSLHCWYCPCCGWLLLEWLFSLCCGQSWVSPLFLHLKQRPLACLFQYSLEDKQLSSIALGSFTELLSNISGQGMMILIWKKNFMKDTQMPHTTMTQSASVLMPWADDKLSIGAKERPPLGINDYSEWLGVGHACILGLLPWVWNPWFRVWVLWWSNPELPPEAVPKTSLSIMHTFESSCWHLNYQISDVLQSSECFTSYMSVHSSGRVQAQMIPTLPIPLNHSIYSLTCCHVRLEIP